MTRTRLLLFFPSPFGRPPLASSIPRSDRVREMKRREFLGSLGGAVAWPIVARAQSPKALPRIGVLWGGERHAPEVEAYIKAFRDGLSALGYVEGKSVLFVDRFAEQYAQFNELARELAQSNVDVLVATSTPTALAAKKATTTIPVVFAYATDPVV